MEDIEIKLMALFILTKGPSLVKISFIWGRGAGPPKSFLRGDLETSNSACIISNQFETKLHWQVFYYKVLSGLQGPLLFRQVFWHFLGVGARENFKIEEKWM